MILNRIFLNGILIESLEEKARRFCRSPFLLGMSWFSCEEVSYGQYIKICNEISIFKPTIW